MSVVPVDIIRVIIFCQFDGYELYLIMVLVLSEFEHFFHNYLAYVFILCDMPLQVFCPFLIWFTFSLLTDKKFFIY